MRGDGGTDFDMHYFRLVLVILCIGLMCANSKAEWFNEITFVIDETVSPPITVTYDGEKYTVYDSTTINTIGNTYSVTATDSQGVALKYEMKYSTQTMGENSHHYYTYTFYNSHSYDSSGAGDHNLEMDESNNNHERNYETDNLYAQIGHSLSKEAWEHAASEGKGAYPGIHAFTGVSKGFGEFIRLRYVQYGLLLYGGVGKDWLFNGENKDKVLWHVGFGGYYSFGEESYRWGDLGLGMTFAENAGWENQSLTFDVDFTYWFGKWQRIGVFAGGGMGMSDLKHWGNEDRHSQFVWNLEIGLTFRIAHF